MFHYSVQNFGLTFFRNEMKCPKIKRPKFERPHLFASNVPNKVDSYDVDDNDDDNGDDDDDDENRVMPTCHQ